MRPLIMTHQVTIDAPLEEAVAWCRLPASRRCWPGVTWVAKQGTSVLGYEVDMRTRGARPAVLSVEEHLRLTVQTEDAAVFETSQRWAWPNGDQCSAWSTYRFLRQGGSTSLTYDMRVIVPGSASGEHINLARFGEAIERATAIYVSRLAESTRLAAATGTATARK